MADSHADVVIKKVKKGGHGGHHGGAWKVAYADFVTAMMAFFLLLWLLNATSEEQKIGISHYFDPTAVSRSTSSGSGGVLGGQVMTEDGAMKNDSSPPSINDMQAAKKEAAETDAPAEGAAASTDLESRSGAKDGIGPAETAGENPPSSDPAPQTAAATTVTTPDSGETGAEGKEGAAAARGGDGTATGEGSGAALEKMIAERQERAFAAAKEELEKAIEPFIVQENVINMDPAWLPKWN